MQLSDSAGPGPPGGAGPETCRFPKLEECAHFHYERVQLPKLDVRLENDMDKSLHSQHTVSSLDGTTCSDPSEYYTLQVTCRDECWLIQRTLENFAMLDAQLHQCIYDRKVSHLQDFTELLKTKHKRTKSTGSSGPNDGDRLSLTSVTTGASGVADDNDDSSRQDIESILSQYLERLCSIIDNSLNCGPILNWFQLDNRGHRLLVPNEESRNINTPAVAAAYSVRKYVSQARDELSLEVGDMISVIDMASPGESMWWRGKRGFQVGFFPQHCVHIIGDKVPRNMPLPPPVVGSLAISPIKPVLRKHGKLITFFRSFILNRPSRRRLKQSGILKERVFGCDLGEHLLNSGHDIPMVLKCCAEFIESHGIVDGIYRLSGVTSNIQKLRNAFDEDRIPNLYTDDILQDIHSVASLLKMYFRELPNPLCTYQLYHSFVLAVQGCSATRNKDSDNERLLKMREAVQKLPPPHYRTLEYLMRHLSRIAAHGSRTGMTTRNVAIVWAPNLLRCEELEVGGVAALQGVGVQAVVTEFLVCYADLIFSERIPPVLEENLTRLSNAAAAAAAASSTTTTAAVIEQQQQQQRELSPKRSRPKSLAISTPTKLLTLEEARNKHLLNKVDDTNYIEVGGGPKSLPKTYHTVIELPAGSRKRGLNKRSPSGWRSFFSKSRNSSHGNLVSSKREIISSPGIVTIDKSVTESDFSEIKRKLRPVKSAESLTSGQSEPQTCDSDVLGPLHCLQKQSGHNRSVSHDSYFDNLQNSQNNSVGSLLDLSEIQLNFELEESEMRIFSEDESLVSSPKVHKETSSTRKTLSRTRFDDTYSSSCTNSSNPSPKKQPRVILSPDSMSRKRSRLEDQLSDIQYIDCNTPENPCVISTTAQVHTHDEYCDGTGPGINSTISTASTIFDNKIPAYEVFEAYQPKNKSPRNSSDGSNRYSLNFEKIDTICAKMPKSLTDTDFTLQTAAPSTSPPPPPSSSSSHHHSFTLTPTPQTPNYKPLDSTGTTNTPILSSPDVVNNHQNHHHYQPYNGTNNNNTNNTQNSNHNHRQNHHHHHHRYSMQFEKNNSSALLLRNSQSNYLSSGEPTSIDSDNTYENISLAGQRHHHQQQQKQHDNNDDDDDVNNVQQQQHYSKRYSNYYEKTQSPPNQHQHRNGDDNDDDGQIYEDIETGTDVICPVSPTYENILTTISIVYKSPVKSRKNSENIYENISITPDQTETAIVPTVAASLPNQEASQPTVIGSQNNNTTTVAAAGGGDTAIATATAPIDDDDNSKNVGDGSGSLSSLPTTPTTMSAKVSLETTFDESITTICSDTISADDGSTLRNSGDEPLMSSSSSSLTRPTDLKLSTDQTTATVTSTTNHDNDVVVDNDNGDDDDDENHLEVTGTYRTIEDSSVSSESPKENDNNNISKKSLLTPPTTDDVSLSSDVNSSSNSNSSLQHVTSSINSPSAATTATATTNNVTNCTTQMSHLEISETEDDCLGDDVKSPTLSLSSSASSSFTADKRKSCDAELLDENTIYQQVKYFRRSIHEINTLLDLPIPEIDHHQQHHHQHQRLLPATSENNKPPIENDTQTKHQHFVPENSLPTLNSKTKTNLCSSSQLKSNDNNTQIQQQQPVDNTFSNRNDNDDKWSTDDSRQQSIVNNYDNIEYDSLEADDTTSYYDNVPETIILQQKENENDENNRPNNKNTTTTAAPAAVAAAASSSVPEYLRTVSDPGANSNSACCFRTVHEPTRTIPDNSRIRMHENLPKKLEISENEAHDLAVCAKCNSDTITSECLSTSPTTTTSTTTSTAAAATGTIGINVKNLTSKFECKETKSSAATTTAQKIVKQHNYEKDNMPPCLRAKNAKNSIKPMPSSRLPADNDEHPSFTMVFPAGNGPTIQRRKSLDDRTSSYIDSKLIANAGCKLSSVSTSDIRHETAATAAAAAAATATTAVSTSSISQTANSRPSFESLLLINNTSLQSGIGLGSSEQKLNRERIEKYKEERRNFWREKYRSESFKEDKDKLLTRLKQKSFKVTATNNDGKEQIEPNAGLGLVGNFKNKFEQSATAAATGTTLPVAKQQSTGAKSPLTDRKQKQNNSNSNLRELSDRLMDDTLPVEEVTCTLRKGSSKEDEFLRYRRGDGESERIARRHASAPAVASSSSSSTTTSSFERNIDDDDRDRKMNNLESKTPRKEKCSPSYCIKDMKAIFESKSQQ